jgi:hypothetical protein
MKTHLLLIPMLLLCACRTTAGTKEKPNKSPQYSAKSEMLLHKIIGGFADEKRDESQYFECKVMSDIAEAAQVKKWIADLPRETITGYHIMARSPSLQLYAYEGSNQIVIFTDWSQITQAKAESASEKTAVDELSKIIEKYCPTPERKPQP